MYTPDDLSLALQVAEYPDECLKTRAQQVFDFEPVPDILKGMRMTALLKYAPYLAATQVKNPLRIIFLTRSGYGLINPEIVSRGYDTMAVRMRCASFPGQLFAPARASHVILQAQDTKGDKIVQELKMAEAVFAQVAIEYLNGQTLASELTWCERFKLHMQKKKS